MTQEDRDIRKSLGIKSRLLFSYVMRNISGQIVSLACSNTKRFQMYLYYSDDCLVNKINSRT